MDIKLEMLEENVLWRCLYYCDDYGALPSETYDLVKVLELQIPEKTLADIINSFLNKEIMHTYESSGRIWLLINNFGDYIRIMPKDRKYPAPMRDIKTKIVCSSAHITDAALATVNKSYNDNIAPISRAVAERLQEYLKKELTAELITTVIEYSAMRNARSFAYVNKVLESCLAENVKTINDWQAKTNKQVVNTVKKDILKKRIGVPKFNVK